MGGWISYMWWGGNPDTPNPASGLSRRDIYAVQKSWAVAYADSVATGTELLLRLFREYPETRTFFRMIKDKSEPEEFTQSPQFKAHVINLMTAINQAVNHLHQPEIVAVMMQKLGETHKRRKIKQLHFQQLKEVIVKLFIDVLNPDEATLGSWGRVVGFWYKHIFQTLESTEER